ncbi:vacuolar protein sorting-associated protein 37A [Bacillus rossius redtenbacheri]|uniref:vacuolar protein sorting-associated protein 37A n=1 Tax=Bacillus rossius redtenbacheri TaxID=93214 RepID=UPI002FDDCDB8
MFPRIFRSDTENVAANRKRQIDTLKIFNDNVTELQEDAEYQVEFTAAGAPMAVLVTLGPDFPLEKPVLKITPPVVHPWVSDQGEITSAPGLLNFTVHSDLGRVVQAIIGEFSRNPPSLSSEAAAGVNHRGSDRATSDQSSPAPAPPWGPGGGAGPRGPALFPELLDLGTEELRALDASADRREAFLRGLPQTSALDAQVASTMAGTEELAKGNLARRPELERLRESIADKMETLRALKNSYDSLSQDYQRISEKYAPENIRDLLRLAAAECDEETDRLAERFLASNIDVDEFVNVYIEKKMLSQLRKTKEEKLTSQLKELQRAGY